MCGRYYFEMEDHEAFHKIKNKVEQLSLFSYSKKEIFPSQNALVMIAGGDDYTLDVMRWGVEGWNGNLLINARSEGIGTKKTFQPMLSNRCLIPCNGFFEWVKTGNKKHKIWIRKKEQPLMYLAGIYNDQKEFVIITGASSDEMKKVHDRTPIILSESQIEAYLQHKISFDIDNRDLVFKEVNTK